MTNINLKNRGGGEQENQVTQQRHNRKKRPKHSRTTAFLPTVFVLFFPHCDEERRDSTAIFFCPSPVSSFHSWCVSSFSRLLNYLCRFTRGFFCCVATERQMSHKSRPARSETRVKRNVRSKTFKRPTQTENGDEKNGGHGNKNKEL